MSLALKRVVVVGHGMVGHRFIESMIAAGHHRDWEITTFCEEPRGAYDRVKEPAMLETDRTPRVAPGVKVVLNP